MRASRLTLIFWLFFVAPGLLCAAEPEDLLSAGIERFESGDLQAARRHFEAARAAGLESVSLTYNLAVVHYRLGDYKAAESGFRKLLATSHRPLASYNLGLVALARGDQASARRWFLKVREAETPEPLRALAEAQLQKFREPKHRSRGRSSGYVGLTAGYDSNIAGLPETSTSRKGGGFAEGIVAGSLPLHALDSGRFSLQGTAYGRKYPAHSEYDTHLLQARLLWSRFLTSGKQGVGVTLSQSWFDKEALESRYGAEGFQQWHSCGGAVAMTGCTVSLAAARVSGGSNYEAYDGQWYQLRLSAERSLGPWRVTGRYRWEINDRQGLRSGDQFISVSPVSHDVELSAAYTFKPDLHVGTVAVARYSRFTNDHVLFSGSELVRERRKDLRTELGLFTEYGLDRRWQLIAEWRFRDNDSAINRYDYSRHTVMATLEAGF